MSRNSIGQFIAALRKANGMTQQDVADRLNVSNKAVSRWERDECAPDISLIPSIAEMFGVTCDELLRGRRIFDSDSPNESNREDTQNENEEGNREKKDTRVQKQIKGLINRTLSSFKTLNYISMAVSLVGLICMFGISYGFFRPIIGFGVMLLLEVGALFLSIAALSRAKAVKADNELFEEADEALIAKFDNTLASFSFTAFFAVLSVVLLSLPLIIFTSDYVESVLSFESYITQIFGGIALILAFVFIKCRKPYIRRISDKAKEGLNSLVKGKITVMNLIQIGSIVILGLIAAFLPVYVVPTMLALCCLAAGIACFVVFLIKNREHRGAFVFHGLRNIFLIPAALLFSNCNTIWWSGDSEWERHDLFNPQWIWYTVVYAILICLIFSVIDIFVKSNKEKI